MHKNIVRNRAEMFAYNLIAMAASNEVITHIVQIKWEDFSGAEQNELVREALRIQQVVQHKNWVEYFRTLRRPTTNYFFACLMLSHISSMRLTAIYNLYVAHIFTGLPASLVMSKLNLPSEDDAEDLIAACGFYKTQSEKVKIKRIEDADVWMESFKKWRQSGPLREHDLLRGVVRRSRLIKHGSEALLEHEADLGKENNLDDVEAILNMPHEDEPAPINPMKRQESIARRQKEQEHQRQLA